MDFYDREYELNTLKRNWEQSASHSMMTTMIGRRRIGKTSLLLKSAEGHRVWLNSTSAPQITEQIFHKSPNKSSINNRTNLPQITENCKKVLVVVCKVIN